MSYSYDGDGNRISKGFVVGLGYTLDVNRALPVVVADVENKYVWGASLTHARGLLGSVTLEGNTVPLQLGVVHADGLGSVRALTSEDGSVFQTYRSDEFGVPITADSLGASLQPFQFAGEQRDLETGFVYLRARYYAPEIGRFITRDRWPGTAGRPWTLNRCAYVGSNPVTLTDPSGLAPTPEPPRMISDQLDEAPHVTEPASADLVSRCVESVEGVIVLAGASAVVIAGGATLLAGAGAAGATGGGLIASGAFVIGGLELIGTGALGFATAELLFELTCGPLVNAILSR